jgi:hypothetical protein
MLLLPLLLRPAWVLWLLPILFQLILPLRQPLLLLLLLLQRPHQQLAYHQTLLLPQLPGQQAKLLMLPLLLPVVLAGWVMLQKSH